MKILLTAAVASVIAAPAMAQVPIAQMPLYYVPAIPGRIEGMMREQPRAEGPSLAYAILLAQAAVDACAAKGGQVSVLVTDSVGTTVVFLSGDGAGERSGLITSTKAHAVVKYRMPSDELAKRAAVDPKLKKAIQDNPNIGAVRGGAFPLMRGQQLLGALSVSGFTGEDENCAKEAMAKVPLR